MLDIGCANWTRGGTQRLADVRRRGRAAMSESEHQFRPLGTWPRKPTVDRKRHPFKQTYSDTLRIMDYELWKLSALLPIVIEADFPEWAIRNDGRILADAPEAELARRHHLVQDKKIWSAQIHL